MGTNYYATSKKCPHCGRQDEHIHLGKSSAGWKFIFNSNYGEYYKSVKEMKEWLVGKTIENEYGDEISHDEFWTMVENKQKLQSHQNSYWRDDDYVIDGYEFTTGDFC